MTRSSQFSSGDLVEVRSREEILATLDADGTLDGLPFMPEMFAFCGHRFSVFKRAHKTCDPPNGLSGRRMANAVHLENVRCTGDAHGGCQAGCLVFWKDSWLRKVDAGRSGASAQMPFAPRSEPTRGCTEADVNRAAIAPADPADPDEPRYSCQSTRLANATRALPWWDARQYIEDYTSGNERISRMLVSGFLTVYYELATAGLGLGAAMRWLFDVVQKARGATPYPWRLGRVPVGVRTPSAKLDVQPGQLVKIKTYDEILATLNEQGHNRGMWFDAELVPYCGGTYRVHSRVNKILDEKTGRMQRMKNDCIVLEDVVCRACYARNRKFCPRSIFAYWREIWLEQVQ